jgi:EAL domain-containing protein (putative c-di-GMP-specific phosphodiesterase class I)
VVSKLMIDAGHLLGAVVVAEGIETIADADTLTRMGVDELQGYHLFHPESPDRVWEAITAQAVELRSGNARVGIAE